MELHEVLDRFEEISLIESDDEVIRQTHAIIKGVVLPSNDPSYKAKVLNSKIFTKIIERTAWILEDEEERDRVFGKPPCRLCETRYDCWHCKEKQARIAKFKAMKGK
jgi:hypothetical protein